MKVIVCGAGLVGFDAARYLIEDGNDVTVVDNNIDFISKVSDMLDCRVQLGHACSPDVLESAGIEGADMIIATTRHDEINMIACQVAGKIFGIPKKLARIRKTSYLKPQWNGLFADACCPVDVIISPEKEVAETILRCIKSPGALDVFPMCGGKVSVVGIMVSASAKILNTPIAFLIAEYAKVQMSIVVIVRGGTVLFPTDDMVILPTDKVYFACATCHMHYCLNMFGHDVYQCSRPLIIGGGNIGGYVAKTLEDEGVEVCIIENNKDIARKLAANMPSTTIIHGDLVEAEILEQARMRNSDICVAVTNIDESNIFGSCLMKNSGVEKSIVLVKNPAYTKLSHNLGMDVIINPKDITASIILQSLCYGIVKSLHVVQGRAVEIMELEVVLDAPICGKTRKHFHKKKGVYFSLLSRDDDIFSITDRTIFREHDRIIILTLPKMYNSVIEMFSSERSFY